MVEAVASGEREFAIYETHTAYSVCMCVCIMSLILIRT